MAALSLPLATPCASGALLCRTRAAGSLPISSSNEPADVKSHPKSRDTMRARKDGALRTRGATANSCASARRVACASGTPAARRPSAARQSRPRPPPLPSTAYSSGEFAILPMIVVCRRATTYAAAGAPPVVGSAVGSGEGGGGSHCCQALESPTPPVPLKCDVHCGGGLLTIGCPPKRGFDPNDASAASAKDARATNGGGPRPKNEEELAAWCAPPLLAPNPPPPPAPSWGEEGDASGVERREPCALPGAVVFAAVVGQ